MHIYTYKTNVNSEIPMMRFPNEQSVSSKSDITEHKK